MLTGQDLHSCVVKLITRMLRISTLEQIPGKYKPFAGLHGLPRGLGRQQWTSKRCLSAKAARSRHVIGGEAYSTQQTVACLMPSVQPIIAHWTHLLFGLGVGGGLPMKDSPPQQQQCRHVDDSIRLPVATTRPNKGTYQRRSHCRFQLSVCPCRTGHNGGYHIGSWGSHVCQLRGQRVCQLRVDVLEGGGEVPPRCLCGTMKQGWHQDSYKPGSFQRRACAA